MPRLENWYDLLNILKRKSRLFGLLAQRTIRCVFKIKIFALRRRAQSLFTQCGFIWKHFRISRQIGLNSRRSNSTLYYCATLYEWERKMDFVTFKCANSSFLLLLFLLCGRCFVPFRIFWVIIVFSLYFSFFCSQTMSGRFKQEPYLDRGKKLFCLLFHKNLHRTCDLDWFHFAAV